MNFDPDRVQRRVEGMTEGELLDWLGVALPGMQRHLEMYQRSHNPDHLGELAIAEMTANVVILELVGRKFGKPLPADSAPSEPEEVTGTTSVPRLSLWDRPLLRRGHARATKPGMA